MGPRRGALNLIETNATNGQYNTEDDGASHKLGPGLAGLAQSHDSVERDKDHGKRSAEHRHKKESKDPVDPSSAPVSFPVRVILHTATRASPTMEDLHNLVANVGAGFHVAFPAARAWVPQSPEEVDSEVASFSAVRAGVVGEVAESNDCGHLASLGMQFSDPPINDLSRDELTSVAEGIPSAF